MPPKPAGSTRHTLRMDVVRPRLVSVLKHVPLPDPNPTQLTKHGIFARRAAAIAVRENRKWYLPSKDAATSIRRFAEGDQGMSFERMDVIELTCIEFEQELREARRAQRHDGDASERPAEITHTLVDPPIAVKQEERPLWSDDPEIDAMSKVKDAMEPLDNEGRKRVLRYIAERYGVADA